MKFDELDRKMRVFETASDACVLPEIFMQFISDLVEGCSMEGEGLKK